MGLLATVFGLGAAIEFARMNQLGRPLELTSAVLVLGLLGTAAIELSSSAATATRGLDLVWLGLAAGVVLILMFRQPPGEDSLRRARCNLDGPQRASKSQ